MTERLCKVLSRFSENLGWESLASGAIYGMLLMLAIYGFCRSFGKKRKIFSPWLLFWLFCGMICGAYYRVIEYNIMLETGGHFAAEPQYYNPENLRKDLTPAKSSVVFYVAGALDTPDGFPSANAASLPPNTYVFAHADEKKLAAAIDAVPPEFEVVVIGHSTGGGTAIRAARLVKRKIALLITLDPIDLDPVSLKIQNLIGAKPASVELWQNFLPENFQQLDRRGLDPDASDYWVTGNPMRMMNVKGSHTIIVPGDHGMYSSGFRRHWDIHNFPESMHQVRQRVDEELFLPGIPLRHPGLYLELNK